MNHIFFVCSSVDGHLPDFYLLAVVAFLWTLLVSGTVRGSGLWNECGPGLTLRDVTHSVVTGKASELFPSWLRRAVVEANPGAKPSTEKKTWISQIRMMASGGFTRQGVLIWGKTVFLTELQKVKMWGVVRNVAGRVNHSWKNRSKVSWALLKNVEVFLGATGDC